MDSVDRAVFITGAKVQYVCRHQSLSSCHNGGISLHYPRGEALRRDWAWQRESWLICVLPTSSVKVQNPTPPNVTLFRGWAFIFLYLNDNEVIRVSPNLK